MAAKYPSFNFQIDGESVQESIKVSYISGPGVELVKKEFEDMLPVTTDVKFPAQTTNMDLI